MKLYSKNEIKTALIVLSICISCISGKSQDSIPCFKLPATTIIGTELSVDYETNESSTTINTKSNAFDGDMNTFFSSYERSGTWVGLDLGERHIITKIAYAPRNDISIGPRRLLLGIFEGANNPNFSDAVPLFMVADTPQVNVMTEQEINCSRGFRYVRYVGTNNVRCNIAEIEFYGYKGTGNNSHFHQLTNLPTVTISTVNAAEIVDKENYVQGFISVIHNGTIYSDLLEIKGRGNSSWSFPKKPYRIKLRNKTNLLGCPANERNWTLINNYADKTLMRNLLAFELSKLLEMEYTPAGMPIDLILNGEYKGAYHLCDQIEIAPKRVEIQQMAAKDVVLPNLSGGYLLEVDGFAYDEEEGWFISALYNTPVRIRGPKADEIVSQQYYYIRDYYSKMEESVYSIDYQHPVTGYRKYIDTESFMRYFLVGEISGNPDTFWSTYMSKNRNNDFFKFGPIWDFDLSYDNDNRTFPVNAHPLWIYEYGGSAKGFHDIVRRLLSDEDLMAQLKAMYIDYRERGILTKELLFQVVDNYALQLDQSQRLNFMRWNILNKYVHLNPQVFDSYEEEVNNVKRFISERIDWIDKKFDYEPSGNSFKSSDLSSIIVYALTNTICFNNVIEPVNVVIADITGRIIFSKLMRDNTSVPVHKGAYIIIISNSKGLIKTEKCIVT